MAKKNPLTLGERQLLTRLLARYDANRDIIEVMLKQLSDAILGSPALMTHVHSTKGRLKDIDHLERKLRLKMVEAKEKKKKSAPLPTLPPIRMPKTETKIYSDPPDPRLRRRGLVDGPRRALSTRRR